MESMKKSEFLALIEENERNQWLLPKWITEQLGLHISQDDRVLGWLEFFNELYYSRRTTIYGIVTQKLFILVRSIDQESSGMTVYKVDVSVKSVPISELRSVRTERVEEMTHSALSFELEFSEPIFEPVEQWLTETTIQFYGEIPDQGGERERYFLEAVACARAGWKL